MFPLRGASVSFLELPQKYHIPEAYYLPIGSFKRQLVSLFGFTLNMVPNRPRHVSLQLFFMPVSYITYIMCIPATLQIRPLK